MPINLSAAPATCEHWILVKQTENAIPKVRGCKGIGAVSVCLMESQDVPPAQGSHYVMDLIDDHTSFAWSIPLATKDQAYPELKRWNWHKRLRLD